MPTTGAPRIELPLGHRLTIFVDGDAPILGITVSAFRGEHWLGAETITVWPDRDGFQAIADRLTGRLTAAAAKTRAL